MSQYKGSLKANVLSRHLITMYRHCMRRALEEAPKFCRDMERNIATKLRMEAKRMSLHLIILLRQRIGLMAEKLCHDV